jgi:phosphatidylinositol-3-phosphatase
MSYPASLCRLIVLVSNANQAQQRTMMHSSPDPRVFGLFCLTIALLTAVNCGGASSTSSSGGTSTSGGGSAPASLPQFGHVVLVVEENHGYSDVIGNPAMPYLNSLATKYGLATQYYANIHPSIGNYFMLTTGQIVTSDDSFTGTVSDDNIVRDLLAAGKTWKSYAEGLPSVGYIGADVYPYAKRHNIFTYFTDVVNSSSEINNLVPFSQFGSDVSSGQLPNFSFVVPDLLDDAHDGPLPVADAWLAHNIAPLLNSSTFQKDGLLIIVFDEAGGNDSTHGGGHVAAVIVSPQAKAGYQSTTLYQHQNTLRLILQGLGISSYPGGAAQASDMAEFF